MRKNTSNERKNIDAGDGDVEVVMLGDERREREGERDQLEGEISEQVK